MSRFKFRIWDNLINSFSYFTLRESYGRIPADLTEENIQQFTGLKDKNGEEIYEGDILYKQELNREYCKEVAHGELGVVFKSINSKDKNIFSYIDTKTYKIIGNIFETPDLL